MAIITIENAEVGYGNATVQLRVPIDGRMRTLHLDPVDAVQIANQIATAAIKLAPVAATAAMEPSEFALHPYGEGGKAHLAVLTEYGPFVFALDATGLNAFAQAADAALEFADTAGKG